MATGNLELQSLPVSDSTVPPKKVVNDFSINVATGQWFWIAIGKQHSSSQHLQHGSSGLG